MTKIRQRIEKCQFAKWIIHTDLALSKNAKSGRIVRNQSGSTMIEVLVGFVILLILIAGLTQLVNASSNLHMQSVDIMKGLESFEKEFSKTEHGSLQKQDLGQTKVTLEYKKDDSNVAQNTNFKNVKLNLGQKKIDAVSDDKKDISVRVIDEK